MNGPFGWRASAAAAGLALMLASGAAGQGAGPAPAGRGAAPPSSAHGVAVGALAFTNDGRTLVTAATEGGGPLLKTWSVADGRRLRAFGGDCPGIWSLRATPLAAGVVGSCMDGTVRLWPLDGAPSKTLVRHEAGMVDLGLSADGGRLASGGASLFRAGPLVLTSLPGGREAARIPLAQGMARAALSPDGKLAAVAGPGDAPIELLSLPSGKVLATLSRARDTTALAFSPDGRLLAAGGGRSIGLWSVPDGRAVATLAGHLAAVNQVVFLPDGSLLSASSDRTVKRWTLPEGRLAGTFGGHADEVFGLAVSPDGRLAASADRSGAVLVWEVETMKPRFALVDPAR